MQYEKTVLDSWDDTAKVSASSHDDNVDFWAKQFGASAYLSLTPEQARSLADALNQAANVAEGKPAKAKAPKTYTDRDGDTWHLSPNGFYWCGPGPSKFAARTLEEVKAEYGA